jgi:hypothetical protein
MELRLTGWWALLVLVVIVAMGFGSGLVTMKIVAPALAVQVSGIKQTERNMDANFIEYDKALKAALNAELAKLDKRTKALEARK